MTLDQIRREFFTGRHKTASSKRLLDLSRCGLIKADSIMRNGKMCKCFFPDQKCVELISSGWDFVIDKPHVKSESPEHDIRTTELRIRLEKLSQFNSYFSENLLQSSSQIAEDVVLGDFVKVQPDGVLVIENRDEAPLVYAVECEISAKTVVRYAQKLASYYLSSKVNGVLYVCSKQSIIECLKEADAEVRRNRKSILYFALEKDVLTSFNKITFTNAKEGILEFT